MTRLAYQRAGQGAPLVLLHGFPLDHSFWNPILPHLVTHFDCLMPDLRGFGHSPVTEAGYSLADLAADLSALLAELGLTSAFFAGHSMGGYLALAFARRFEAQLLGLGLLGTQAAPDSLEKKAGRYATIEQVKREGLHALLGMAENLSARPEHVPAFREIILRQSPAGVIGALQAMAERPDALPVVEALKVPLVIVHGLADSLVPVSRAREMHAALPASRLLELPGVGHSPPYEAPAETALALKQLL